jgi:hypothetical protein
MKKLFVLPAFLAAVVFSSCSQVAVSDTETSDFLGSRVYIKTNTEGPSISDAMADSIRNAQVVKHTFSDDSVMYFFNTNGAARTTSGRHGGISVAKMSKLPEWIIENEKYLHHLTTQGIGISPDVYNKSLSGPLWSSGVPYTIDSNITGTNLDIVKRAIQQWNSSSFVSVKFRPRVGSEPATIFTRGTSNDGCSSYVGNFNEYDEETGTYDGQTLTLASGCYTIDTIHHEMGHAVGLFHEQQRCDRDSFVSVTSSGRRDAVNYGRLCTKGVTDYGIYNFGSVMHYEYDNSMLKLAQPKSTNYVGNPSSPGAVALTPLDGKTINQMYGLSNAPVGVQVQPSLRRNGWQNWVKNNTVAGVADLTNSLDALRISVNGLRSGLNIEYSVHVRDVAWLPYVSNSGVAGITGEGEVLDAFKVKLWGNRDGCTVSYRGYVSGSGWTNYVNEGVVAGTVNQNRSLNAVQVNVQCN